MNPARYIHSVTGERRATTQTSGKADRAWTATNSGATMDVLIEGLPTKTRAAIIGYIPMACYRMSWGGGVDIEEGDRLTYSGKKYLLHDVLDDTTRPSGAYKTGILQRLPNA